MTARRETIEVGYQPITGTGHYHKYIIYTNSDGKKFVAHGHPTNGKGEGPRNRTDPITTFKVSTGDAKDQWDPDGTESADIWEERQREDHVEPIKSGEDLSDAWEKIVATMEHVESSGIEYKLLSQNSNSLVDTALAAAGLPQPQHDEPPPENVDETVVNDSTHHYSSPGSGTMLVDPNAPLPPTNGPPPDGTNPEGGDTDGGDASQKRPLGWPTFGNPPVSPLVLDLDGDGVELTTLEASQTLFDLDADGFAQRTGWVKPDDGLLVIDRNGNGRIDDITELFGNGDTDGFTELRALDSNNDGVINAQDTEIANLRVWQDRDQDGVSDAEEAAPPPARAEATAAD